MVFSIFGSGKETQHFRDLALLITELLDLKLCEVITWYIMRKNGYTSGHSCVLFNL